jgi:hypothetical protein
MRIIETILMWLVVAAFSLALNTAAGLIGI